MLEGRLVGLREQRRDDVEVMHSLHADPDHVALADTHPFYPRPLAARLAQYDRRLTETDDAVAPFTVQRLDDPVGACVGTTVLWSIDRHHRTAHIGVSLVPSVRGQGLGRDTVAVVCRYGFEVLGLERLSLETLAVNTAMQRTAVACGFVEEGRLRGAAWYLGRRVDDVLYGLLAQEWRTLPDRDRRDEHDESRSFPASSEPMARSG